MRYIFSYDGYTIVFEVDKAIFNEAAAKEFLEFYSWDFEEDDYILSALKKLAIKCFAAAFSIGFDRGYCDMENIIKEFKNWEAYPVLDGSSGIEIKSCEIMQLDESYLEIESILEK